ncbi:MAG: response regulator transcription factor [Flavobacteriia bacterium]|nr:response regulator transcription factor [Flavobacteriia bacterium]
MDKNCAVIVEDYKLIAQAWARILEKSQLFSDVHLFFDAEGLEQNIEKLNPEIILMDVNLPNSKNGIEITKKLLAKNPNLKIIILTMHNEPIFVQKAIDAGAKGFVTKNSPLIEISTAIENVLANKQYICNEITNAE